MTRVSASAEQQKGEVERLRSAAAGIAKELRDLGSRVEELSEAVAALDPDSGGHEVEQPRPRRRKSSRPPVEQFRVTVRPLPELAMAAVAETSLRGIPSVKRVLSVERVEDWASFLLEVSAEADLISEMREAMPVGFNVDDSKPNEISLELKWLWGAGSV